MRLADVQGDHAIFLRYGLVLPGGFPNCVGSAIGRVVHAEFNYVVTAETFNQRSGRTFGDDLTVVDNREAITKALGFIHVVRGQQNGPAGTLELTNDVPKLAAALRIESGGGLIEEKNFRVADERGSYGKALALATGEFSNPGIGLLGELQLIHNFRRSARLTVETGEEFDGFADGEFFRELGFLKRYTEPFAEFERFVIPVRPRMVTDPQ